MAGNDPDPLAGFRPPRTRKLALEGPAFDLAATLGSGQAFHWRPAAAGFVGMIGEKAAYLAQPEPGVLRTAGVGEREARRYLGLDHPMEEILASFPPGDPHLAAALDFCPGIRLLEQPRLECLVAFLTSSLKQVAHIAQISHRVRELLGRPVELGGLTLHAFPELEVLASCGEPGLRGCGMGYRAVGVDRTARALLAGEADLEAMASLTDDELRAALLRFHGVGRKIADCVLLFAYSRHAAFPVDVWIRRILHRLYFPGRAEPPGEEESQEFAAAHFGPYAGYAQQFLFHHARVGGALREGALYEDERPAGSAPTSR